MLLKKMNIMLRLKILKITNIPDITNFATNGSLNAQINEVEGEIPSITNLATNAALTAVENKIPNVTSNKAKHVLVENELNELSKKVKLLSTKDYSSFLSRIYFASNDGSQNKFVYQPTLDTLELKKKTKVLIMFLVGNQMDHIILNLSHYILLSCIT